MCSFFLSKTIKPEEGKERKERKLVQNSPSPPARQFALLDAGFFRCLADKLQPPSHTPLPTPWQGCPSSNASARVRAELLSHVHDHVDCGQPGSSPTGFSRQESWSELPRLRPGHLPDPGTEPTALTSPALADRLFPTRAPWEAPRDSRLALSFFLTWVPVPQVQRFSGL